MTNAELDTLWSRAEQFSGGFTRYRFAALVAAAERNRMIADGWRQCAKGQRTSQFCGMVEQEREKVARWMRSMGYATGHGDTTEDLLGELRMEIIEQEREACARVCDPYTHGQWFATAIRARSQKQDPDDGNPSF